MRAAVLAAVIGVGWMVALIVPEMSGDASPLHLLGRGLHSLLLYVPAGFVLEEVSFRGAVDAHVHRPGERFGWLTALYVSALWAVWHLPMDIGSQPLGDLVIGLLVIHISIGVPLSLAWRRSGNLTLPATVHAVIDAVRDGLYRGLWACARHRSQTQVRTALPCGWECSTPRLGVSEQHRSRSPS